MEKFIDIVRQAVEQCATDIHLVQGMSPIYRINRALIRNEKIEPLNRYDLEGLMEALVNESLALVEQFEETKKLDLPFEFDKNIRLRINASMSNGVPTFSIRIIRNRNIDVDSYNLRGIISEIKKHNTGLILITGKVNSGKTTTLNAFVQEVNKYDNKKIVMLEEPIEYKHEPNKCVIIQKEVNRESDINSYYDGVINLLREDSDISIIGEIRDRKTMDAILDLAEAGGLVIGTLHTRSCGETIERILAMYSPNEQTSIKYALSNVLKMVVSQKLVIGKERKPVLIPEIMVSNSTIAALMRQEKFTVSEIRDAIHSGQEQGTVSFEQSFVRLYNKGIIDVEAIKSNVETDSLKLIDQMIGGVI